MSNRVLITGICGFFGRYMGDYIRSLPQSWEIIGIDIAKTQPRNCDAYHQMDLVRANDAEELIRQTLPTYLIHLAGSFGTDNSQEIYQTNVLSLTSLLEALRKHSRQTILITAGSAAEYGLVDSHQLPIDEKTVCKPVTPYGLSKYLATQVALYYHDVHKICTMIVRPFQLLGKGVTTKLAPGAFAEQLRTAMAANDKVIKVGNLESSRDFLDVRDAVKGLWCLCQKPAPGEIFNLCSGKSTKISEMLNLMIRYCGVDVKIEVDPARLRAKADVPVVYGSFEKLKIYCGWQPEINLDDSIAEMFA